MVCNRAEAWLVHATMPVDAGPTWSMNDLAASERDVTASRMGEGVNAPPAVRLDAGAAKRRQRFVGQSITAICNSA